MGAEWGGGEDRVEEPMEEGEIPVQDVRMPLSGELGEPLFQVLDGARLLRAGRLGPGNNVSLPPIICRDGGDVGRMREAASYDVPPHRPVVAILVE